MANTLWLYSCVFLLPADYSSSGEFQNGTSYENSTTPEARISNCSVEGQTVREELQQVSQEHAPLSLEYISVVEAAKKVYKDPLCTDERPYFSESLKTAMKQQAFVGYSASRNINLSTNLLCMTGPGGSSDNCQQENEQNLERIEGNFQSKLDEVDIFFQD